MNLMNMMMMIMSSTTLMFSMTMLLKNKYLFISLPILSHHMWTFHISFMMDWMTMMFLSVVIYISAMIILFSKEYIPKKEHPRFTLILILFMMSMIMVILSDNLMFILLGWDGLGFSSYALVIYYQNSSSSTSGSMTILSNRLGDISMLLAISTLYMSGDLFLWMNLDFPKISMLLIMMAGMTKSAQMPFSAWLPAAMAAPTPISALVHSSTLVTAGVYLLMRVMTQLHHPMMTLLMILASLTALMSGMSANWEKDMKKIIALSTLSQISMMMFSLSLMMNKIAFFHLITHALFKSTMFLCAGYLIHFFSYQDLRNMNFYTKNSPLIITTMGVSSMALMGIPFMSGFYSKDFIMEAMLASTLNMLIISSMLISLGLTVSYTLRMTNIMMKSMMMPETMMNKKSTMPKTILIMAPMSIFTGAIISWLSLPDTLFSMSFMLKISTCTMLTLGLTMGLSLSYKSNYFKKKGLSAINLWYSSILSSYPLLSSMKYNEKSLLLDKTWNEMLSAQGINKMLTKKSMITENLVTTTMFITTIMIISPLMFKN